MAARLALIFHLFELASAGEIQDKIPVISEVTWLNAQMLQEFFLAQAIDSQRTHAKDGLKHLLQKVIRWLKKQVNLGKLSVSEAQISKGVWGIAVAEIKDKVIPALIELHLLRRSGSVNRRGGEQYEINQKINA